MEATSTVGANLRQRRQLQGLTLERVAEQCSELGRPLTTVQLSRMERGERRIDVDDLLVVAMAIGAEPGELLLQRSKDQLLVDASIAARSLSYLRQQIDTTLAEHARLDEELESLAEMLSAATDDVVARFAGEEEAAALVSMVTVEGWPAEALADLKSRLKRARGTQEGTQMPDPEG